MDLLREVVLARRAQRVCAGVRLRGAVGSYLDGFPVQRPELEQALVPAAQLLGVSGLAQADRNETSTVTLVRKALGARAEVTDLEIARVVLLARRLVMPAGQPRQWLGGLGRARGLHARGLPGGRRAVGEERGGGGRGRGEEAGGGGPGPGLPPMLR